MSFSIFPLLSFSFHFLLFYFYFLYFPVVLACISTMQCTNFEIFTRFLYKTLLINLLEMSFVLSYRYLGIFNFFPSWRALNPFRMKLEKYTGAAHSHAVSKQIHEHSEYAIHIRNAWTFCVIVSLVRKFFRIAVKCSFGLCMDLQFNLWTFQYAWSLLSSDWTGIIEF